MGNLMRFIRPEYVLIINSKYENVELTEVASL
jgi:hypothetical protein